ncbi:MAG: hypothetical protein BWY92_01108 [Firmicutes bacterium ADurb.BinA052]|nr:MAG: hypothetical protein BWY92_01108 [Firmicutes bacterium ADurb.BinA052]
MPTKLESYGRASDAQLLGVFNGEHRVYCGVTSAFPSHDQAVGAKHAREFHAEASGTFLMPMGRIMAAAEHDAPEIQLYAVASVEIEQYRVVCVQVGGDLESRPHVIAAYHGAVQHLVGMQPSGNQVVNGVRVEQGVCVYALILALPYQHHLGKAVDRIVY